MKQGVYNFCSMVHSYLVQSWHFHCHSSEHTQRLDVVYKILLDEKYEIQCQLSCKIYVKHPRELFVASLALICGAIDIYVCGYFTPVVGQLIT